MKRKVMGYAAFGLLFLGVIWLVRDDKVADEDQREFIEVPEKMEPKKFYGFDIDDYRLVSDTIKSNQFLADILLPYDISYPEIDELVKNTKDIFNVKNIKANRPYHLLISDDSIASADYMIYEKDPINYVILHLGDSLYASTGQKEVEIRESTASGIIESSLYTALTDQGLSQALAMELSDIYAWTIDFYRIQKGDKFKIIYQNRYIDDEFIGIGEIHACVFQHMEEEFYAYSFEQNGKKEFFDEKGEGLRKAFLKSPLKFGRMSSGYSKRRFHPVQKRYKAHRGTDYAAPTGTPILATGDGTVIKASYTKGNGKYVKIKHNSTFSTQYLHMSKRAVQVGDFVRQGDVIGYVGSTGLATGPHVCYRFWKNGKQVDHRREKFPSTDPVTEENKTAYQRVMDEFNERLSSISYDRHSSLSASK